MCTQYLVSGQKQLVRGHQLLHSPQYYHSMRTDTVQGSGWWLHFHWSSKPHSRRELQWWSSLEWLSPVAELLLDNVKLYFAWFWELEMALATIMGLKPNSKVSMFRIACYTHWTLCRNKPNFPIKGRLIDLIQSHPMHRTQLVNTKAHQLCLSDWPCRYWNIVIIYLPAWWVQ